MEDEINRKEIGRFSANFEISVRPKKTDIGNSIKSLPSELLRRFRKWELKNLNKLE